MASYVPSELQAYGDLINPPSKSFTPTGDFVGIFNNFPVYATKPPDPISIPGEQWYDGPRLVDKATGLSVFQADDGLYHFSGDGESPANLNGMDPSKLFASTTLGKTNWNYGDVYRGNQTTDTNNGDTVSALWGGTSYPMARVTNWDHIDPTQKEAQFTAGQTRDALWNVYDNLVAKGNTPALNPDQIALKLASDNGTGLGRNYNNILGYGAGANSLAIAQTISAVFMNQPQVVAVTQQPYTVSPDSVQKIGDFGTAHNSPQVLNTLSTFVRQGVNSDWGFTATGIAMAIMGGMAASEAITSGLGGATAVDAAGAVVPATTAGVANTSIATVGAGAVSGAINAGVQGGDILKGSLTGAFTSALGLNISPVAKSLVEASNGTINLQVAQAAVQAAAVAAKAGLTGGDVTKAITNSLEGSAISAGMKEMNVPSNIAKIVTPIVVTGLNNGDVNAAIQNSLINYASGFVKSAINPSTTPSTPPAVASPAPDVGQPIATPLAEPTGGLPTNAPVVTAPEQPIVTQPVEPTSGLSAIPDTGQPVATPITDTASGLPVDAQPTPVADTSGGLPTTASVAERTPEQQDKLNNTLASTDTNGITISGLSANTPLQVGGLRSGDKVISTTYGVDEDGNQTVRAVIETGDPSNRVQIYADYDALDLSKPYGFQPIQQGGDPNNVVNGVLIQAYRNEPTFDKNGAIVGNSAPPDTPINNPPNGGLPPTDNPPVDNPLLDVPLLPVNPASGSGGLPTNGSPTPPSNGSGSPNEPPSPNPPVNGSPTAPPVENAPPPSNGLPVENPSSGGTIPPDVPIPNPSSGGTPSTGTLNTAPVDAQGNQIENIKSGLTTLGDTVNANQNTTNTAIGDLSESTKVALANATDQEKSDFEKLNASQQASTIAATEQGVALSKAIEASQSNTESQIGNLSDTVASNQAKTNASLEGLSNEQKANFDAMTKAQQDAAIAQAGVNGSLSKSISNVQNGLDAQGNKIAGLASTVSGLGTTVNGLGTKVGDLGATVGGLGATVSGLGAALDNLSTADKANFATLSDAQKQLAVDEAKSTGDLAKAIADVASSATSGLASIASSVSGLGNTVSANQAATTAANQATNANLNNLKAQQAEQLRSSQLLKADPFLTPNLIMNKKQAMKTEQPISPLNLQGPVAYNETAPIQFEKLQDYAPVSQDFYHGGPVHYADGSGDEPVAKEPTEEDMIALNAQIDAILNKKSSSERPVRVRQDESEMPIHSLIKHHLISSRVKADPLFHGLSAELSHLNAGVSPYISQHYENRQLQGYEPIMRSSEIPGIHQAHGGYIDPKLLAILQKHFVPGPEGHLYQRHEERGFAVGGAGTGQSDDIPTMLSDGEYVVDADTVAALGDGSSKAGAEALDKMREAIRTHKRSAPADKIPPKAKSPLEYLKMSKGR